MPYQSLSRNLLAELMDRWNCEKRAFLLVPGEITITLMDVFVILGLRVTGDPVILKESEPFSELERYYGAAVWNRKIPIAAIEERLDSLGEIANDDFIRSFLLFIFGTVLFPNANGKVDSRYLSLLQDLDKVCHRAWGAAVLENVVDWLCKRRETNAQYVGGCLIFLQIVWKLQLTSEELKMDTIKELLEAQSDAKELAAQRSNVSIEKQADNVRTRLQIMDQWIAEMGNESKTDGVREVHEIEEDSSKLLPMSPTENEDILFTSHNESKVQGVNMEQPWTISDSSSPIIISDDEDEDKLRAREQNMKLRKENDDLRKENQLLRNQLLSSSTLEKDLRNEVDNLRRENQLSNSLVARLERLVFAEDVNATEGPSSAYDGNGNSVLTHDLPG